MKYTNIQIRMSDDDKETKQMYVISSVKVLSMGLFMKANVFGRHKKVFLTYYFRNY